MAEISELWRVVEQWLDRVQFRPTQSKLADSIGVQRSAVSDWKSGKSKPTPENMRRLADLMEPTMGPDIYTDLVAAMTIDMGFFSGVSSGERMTLTKWRERAPSAKFTYTGGGKEGYGVLSGLPVSDDADTDDDLIAAHDEDGPISGETGHDDIP